MPDVSKLNMESIDLNAGNISRSFICCKIGEGDANGDRFGAEVFRGKEEVDLSAVSCVAYFIRSDGTTVLLEGYTEGNRCFVDLPASCYAVVGVFSLIIKIADSNDASVTVRIIDGTVVETTTEEIIDPGNIIPDLNDYTALVERAEELISDMEEFDIQNIQITGTRYRIVAVTPE